MEMCLFVGKLVILVNGSATQEINIQKMLKQGGSLTPLLFLLGFEGLKNLVRRVIYTCLILGFSGWFWCRRDAC